MEVEGIGGMMGKKGVARGEGRGMREGRKGEGGGALC